MKIKKLVVQIPKLDVGKQVEQAVKAEKAVREGVTRKLDAFEPPAPPKLPTWLYDSSARQSDGKVFVVDAETGETRPYDPQRDQDAIVFQNGINTSEQDATENGMALSRKTGRPVIVVYNATEGTVPDIGQSILDKVDPFGVVHTNKATDSQADLMYAAAKGGQEQHFVAHSQGAIITRDALIRTHAKLYAEKYGETFSRTRNPVKAHLEASAYADEKIKNVHVVDAGGAAWLWPPYANVEHVSNVADPVPNFFGQTVLTDPRGAARSVGAPVPPGPERGDLEVIHEPTPGPGGIGGHSFENVYCDDVAEKID